MTPAIDWPQSIREINNLPETDKHDIYKTLLPDWLFTRYGVDKQTLRITSPSCISDVRLEHVQWS